MRVFVTGATGFLGRALVQRLLGAGHQVIALARNPQRAHDQLGAEVATCKASDTLTTWADALAHCDAVVNLAGESVIAKRWTKARRQALWQSRVNLTARLVEALSLASPRPRVLLSASGINYYGDRGDEELHEDSAPGTDFLARLCVAWEDAANAARPLKVRVATLRFGPVLGNGGGYLAAMTVPFSLGVGGPVAGGKQYVSWVHLDDVLDVIVQGLSNAYVDGPFNVTAPAPVRQRELARQLGAALHRPAVMPAPRLAIAAVLGSRGRLATQSQRALPARLQQLGYGFRHPALAGALSNLFATRAAVTVRRLSNEQAQRAPHSARYVLETTTRLDAPVERAFEFFGKAQNLGLITPRFMHFQLLSEPARDVAEGTLLDYRIRLFAVPLRWRTMIRSWDPPRSFVDTQVRGPYRLWWHEHVLERLDRGTRMIDRVYYAPPLGPLASVLNSIAIRATLRAIFTYRKNAVERLFGAGAQNAIPSQARAR